MGLRIDPGSGGQFRDVVQKIMEAESKPVRTLEARKAKEDARMKLFTEFKTKVSGMGPLLADIATFRKFRELKADAGDGDNLISVSLDKDRAEAGKYLMEIDQLAQRSSSISNGFEDPDSNSLGIGFITMTLANGKTDEIYIDEKNCSLRGIAALINHRRNSSVQAAVIKDASEPDAPWKLIISAKKDGEFNQVDFPQFYFLDGANDFYVNDDHDAANAEITIDDFPIELESNDVNDFLPGVNIHLKQANPDLPFTLTISEDYPKIAAKVKSLLDQVNQVLQFIYKQNAIDQHSDTSTTFAGDSTLQGLEYLLRNVFHQGYEVYDEESGQTEVVHLSNIGIEFEKSGVVTMKTDKFIKHLEANFVVIADAFTTEDGFVATLKEVLDTYSTPGMGFLSVKEEGLRSRIREMDRQIDAKSRFLDKKKQDVVGKFARLEATLANLQKQQQYLASTLPSGGGISQLIGG